MEPRQITVLKDKDKDKPLDGSGVALMAITKDLTTRIGADQEIVHNPPGHDSPLEMTMRWIHPPSSEKRLTTRNVRNTVRLADASNAESKATSFAIAPIRNLEIGRAHV